LAQLKVSLENIIPLTEARDHFSQIVTEVQRDKLYVLTKGGKPAVAIIDVKYLETITGGAVNQVRIEDEIQKDPAKVGRTPMYKHDTALKTPVENALPPKSFSPNMPNQNSNPPVVNQNTSSMNSNNNAINGNSPLPQRNKPLPLIPPKTMSSQPIPVESPINSQTSPTPAVSPAISPAVPVVNSTPPVTSTPPAVSTNAIPAVTPAAPQPTAPAMNPASSISTSTSTPDMSIGPAAAANPPSGSTISVNVAPDVEDEDSADKRVAQDDKPGPAQYSGDTNVGDMDI